MVSPPLKASAAVFVAGTFWNFVIYCSRTGVVRKRNVRQNTESEAFIGDVVATEDVAINTKGGSMSATLKKPLRERLGDVGMAAGAALEFDTGQAVVILSRRSGTSEAPVRIRKLGTNRFELRIDGGDDVEIDGVTAAFLRLKRALFERGELELSVPVSADRWRAAIAAKLRPGEAAAEAVTRSATPTMSAD